MGVPFDANAVPTPAYVVDRGLLEQNLRMLRQVADAAGCRILLAQKAFSMHYFYPLIARYLDGTTASGLFEARLGREAMGKETHIFSAAYRPDEIGDVIALCDHLVFNSLTEWERYAPRAIAAGKSCGLRVNPACSTQGGGIYDPCAPGSRLGILRGALGDALPPGVEGLHFHTLCEQGADALEKTLDAFEAQFGAFLPGLRWLNLGGGHHITRPGYDRERLIALVGRLRERYGVTVYLEPGEAVALDAGFLVSSVLDVTENNGVNVILDASAACHMPDVLEMPYRPPVVGGGLPDALPYRCRLGGPTCLAGDVIGEYSFARPLTPGDRVVFGDMAIYSMVKNNTFNGMALPSIYASDGGELTLVRAFGYGDFAMRLS